MSDIILQSIIMRHRINKLIISIFLIYVNLFLIIDDIETKVYY